MADYRKKAKLDLLYPNWNRLGI
ncbi:hypothetical protein BTH160X_290012 [Brochothrix thermosphacta]|nr:hypothetical protein BTH160X_290012 [Brochothrix thermosphacta]